MSMGRPPPGWEASHRQPPPLLTKWLDLGHLSATGVFKHLMQLATGILVLLFLGQAATMPAVSDIMGAGLEVFQLPLSARLVEAAMAILSVGLVTLTYTILIQRGSLMATTSLYPRRPIEANIGTLLDAAWPTSALDPAKAASASKGASGHAIRLFYIGKMTKDGGNGRVAKGRMEASAAPEGEEQRRALWLTSGSALTKNVAQLLVWESASLWLVVLMLLSTLLFNGFLTGNLNPDSFPRLTIVVLFVAAYVVHFCYVWMACLRFFRNVFGGAAWSLLERANFVVAETNKLQRHTSGSSFSFRSIDKASESYVPTVFTATLGSPDASSAINPIPSPPVPLDEKLTQVSSSTTLLGSHGPFSSGAREEASDLTELRAALGAIDDTQKAERATATAASTLALDRVIANTMLVMGVTLSSGFAAWTSAQMTENSPNNTTTTQIGSLALLASLALGAAAMFTSAMHLEIMGTAFRNVLSLKEVKINGLAVDHYRKRRSGAVDIPGGKRGDAGQSTSLAFTQGTVELAEVELRDIFQTNTQSRGLGGLFGLAFFGPAYALLPVMGDHQRKSQQMDFDFLARVGTGHVLFTTRPTDSHARTPDGLNVEAINVCHAAVERYGTQSC
ncbi:hypothetical protein MAPG_08692 [Magnaporthiopsis poae ATCC 64411]|uniref:Uncharacterized protein n=1 Tax=Magnaporthiopsis poae (strain ATCC 64411 / 73-15) TaxID=644358 RepID=A0A0C4E806_MAGP6|nr:hypothetical protein MAPG_08692 [Magnaporthiopsis poae ATCC 64411]